MTKTWMAGIAAGLFLVAAPRARAEDWRLLRGDMSGILTFQAVVIEDEPAWVRLWAEHRRNALAVQSVPPVNFSREMVVGVFLGRRPTTGYSIDVDVRPADGDPQILLVTYREIPPPPDTPQAAIVTSPFLLVKLPKTCASVRIVAAEPSPRAKAPPPPNKSSSLDRSMDGGAALLFSIPQRELSDGVSK